MLFSKLLNPIAHCNCWITETDRPWYQTLLSWPVLIAVLHKEMTTTGQPISTHLVDISLDNNNLLLIDFELNWMAQHSIRVHIVKSGRSMVLTELLKDVFHHQIAIVRHFRQTRVADFRQIHFHSFANSPRHRLSGNHTVCCCRVQLQLLSFSDLAGPSIK